MDPRNEFDQTGCAWPRAPIDPADPLGQGELFTDDYRRLPTTKPSPPPPRANQSSGQSPPAPTSRPPTGRRRPRRPWRRHRPSHPLGSPRARRRPGACLRIFLKKAGFLTPIGCRPASTHRSPRDECPPTASHASIRTRPPLAAAAPKIPPHPHPPPSRNRLIYATSIPIPPCPAP